MKIPKIDIMMPSINASEIFDVQPMTIPTGEIFKLKVSTESPKYEFGDVLHSFMEGWIVYDGKSFVNFMTFIDKYGTEPLHPSMKETLSQWYYNETAGIK